MPKNDEHSVTYSHLVGDMYARWVLDGLADIAYAVSKDFIARPEFYKGFDIPSGIVELRIEYGTKASLPNRSQRQDINAPIFGASDGYPADTTNDKFRLLRKPLFDACITLSELTATTAAAKLRPVVLLKLDLLQKRLKLFDGESIRRSYQQVLHVSKLAASILAGVSQVFCVSPGLPNTWPFESDEANGLLLIRAISEKLPLSPELTFNEDRFQRLQGVAQQGRKALHSILNANADSPEDFDGLVTSVYSWAMCLRDYSGPLKP
ncbi:MAG: hypothetical protein LAQ69_31010 [Acidobacteriia bacterium]|nr:hypothetical protein [Terriglobia bacterium]